MTTQYGVNNLDCNGAARIGAIHRNSSVFRRDDTVRGDGDVDIGCLGIASRRRARLGNNVGSCRQTNQVTSIATRHSSTTLSGIIGTIRPYRTGYRTIIGAIPNTIDLAVSTRDRQLNTP